MIFLALLLIFPLLYVALPVLVMFRLAERV